MWQTRKINFLTGALLFGAVLMNANTGAAASHGRVVSLHPHAPEVDMMITGANGNTRHIKNLPASGKDKSKCPLCFHRDLMKTQQGNKLLKQPFPGD